MMPVSAARSSTRGLPPSLCGFLGQQPLDHLSQLVTHQLFSHVPSLPTLSDFERLSRTLEKVILDFPR